MKHGKVWGSTEEIFSNGITSTHLIKIRKGGYCSEHRHERKTNKFHVILGELEISIWEDRDTVDKTVIEAGQSTTVPFGVWHQFRALTDVLCLEVYEVKFSGEDITRRTQGGKV